MDARGQPDRYQMYNSNKLKIGLFGANCSSGRVVTKVPERWSGTWADNLKLARMADEGGIDFMLPLGRWKGYGGETDYEGESLETLTWASGLLASTRHMTVFGTVHAPLFNPIMAAKQMVTADQIGEGRFGLNIVVGWNEDEFEMFGVKQRQHEARYEYAQEWLDVLDQIWAGKTDFDYAGKFLDMKGIRVKPRPYDGTRPLIMNAGISATGQAFAVKNCDAFFMHASRDAVAETAANVAAVRKQAIAAGREIDCYTVGIVVCRKTQKEAEEYFHHAVIEHADWSAVEGRIRGRGITPEALGMEEYVKRRNAMGITMGGLPIVGDADHVAEELASYSKAGLTGLGLSMVNFLDDTPYFCEAVLGRLARMGLRQAVN